MPLLSSKNPTMAFPRSRAPLFFLLLLLPLWTHIAPAQAADGGHTLEGLDGTPLDNAVLERGTVLVVVWASWSPRCRDIVERINALTRRWSGEARIVTISFQEDADDVSAFLARHPRLEAPVYLDTRGAFAKKHEVTHLPGLLILRGGKPLARLAMPANPDPLIERSLAAGR